MQFHIPKSALLISIFIPHMDYAQLQKLADERKVQFEQGYKERIYEKREVEHYLNRINKYFLIDPLKELFTNFSTLNKIYNDNLPLAADLTAYYQNQFMRTELYWASRKVGTRSQKYTSDQIEEMVQKINAKIDQLVSKHVDSIAAFEKANKQADTGMTGGSPATWGPDRPLGNDTSTWKFKVQEPKDLSALGSALKEEDALIGNDHRIRNKNK